MYHLIKSICENASDITYKFDYSISVNSFLFLPNCWQNIRLVLINVRYRHWFALSVNASQIKQQISNLKIERVCLSKNFGRKYIVYMTRWGWWVTESQAVIPENNQTEVLHLFKAHLLMITWVGVKLKNFHASSVCCLLVAAMYTWAKLLILYMVPTSTPPWEIRSYSC